jgi:aspartate/methionine/tyrosine aminotransferase
LPVKPAPVWDKVELGEEDPLRNNVRELSRSGKKVLQITSGDPPAWGFSNQPLSKYLIEAAEQGWHTYSGKANEQGLSTSPPLISQLQNAIAEFEKREHNLELKPNNIIVAGGAAGAILTVHMALLGNGDEVATFEPAHYLVGPSSYFSWLGAKAVPSRCIESEGWRPDFEELRKKISKKTKLIVINNPANPTGKVYTEKELKELVNIAGEHDLPILSDEIYGFITFDGVVAKSTAAISGDVPVIVVNGLAKTFMRTGWKIGYAAFHDPENKLQDLLDATKKAWQVYGGMRRSLSTPMIYAAVKSFQGSLDAGKEFIQGVKKLRDYSVKRIREIKGLSVVEPKGTFYVFPRVESIGKEKTWKTDVEFLTDLLNEELVSFNPGSQYGEHGFGHFRSLTLPKIEILDDAFNRVERFLKKHIIQ